MIAAPITIDDFEYLIRDEGLTDEYLLVMTSILNEVKPHVKTFNANTDELISIAAQHSSTYSLLTDERKESFNGLLRMKVFFCSDPHEIVLDLNAPEIFGEVEVYLGGIGRISYEDGTEQFVDEMGREYSPRLSAKELEVFCSDNLDKYISFHSENVRSIVWGVTPAMNKFW